MLSSRVRLAIIALLLGLGIGTAPAHAAVLYFNGPIDGITNGTNIATGAAADSFTLSGPSQLTSAEFGAWVGTRHLFNTVDWAILDGIPGTGTVLYSGTAAALNSYVFTNLFNYDVYVTGFFLPLVNLGSGTYWLELSNATGDTSDILWDINGGASRAWTAADGEVTTCAPAVFPNGRCSNSFEINGNLVAAVPEPASRDLALTALLLLGFFVPLRRISRQGRP